MDKTIFLTGGSGFVGQHFIRYLVDKGYRILAMARSKGAAQMVEKAGAEAILDDLTNLSTSTRSALSESDIVIHSAAYMDFTYNKAKFYKINVDATRQLLQLAKESNIDRFIYISAAPVVPGSPVENITEAQAEKGLPKALYPKTKAIGERIVLAQNEPNFFTISLRPPLIWGPNNHHLSEILDRVKSDKWMWIGGGRQKLSTVHIYNLCHALECAMIRGRGGHAYFITDTDQRSMRETFEGIIKANGIAVPNKEIPLFVVNTLAHPCEFLWKTLRLQSRPPVMPLAIRLMGREFSVNDQKARTELGYKPILTFEEGLKEMQNQRNINYA